MRTRWSMTMMAALPGLLAALALLGPWGHARASASPTPPPPKRLVLTSPDFKNGGTLGLNQVNGACGGHDISPALKWHGVPLGTKSFVLLMHDPDALKAGGFWHWAVYDIPAHVRSLPADAGNVHKRLMPANAVQARSDFGTLGYGGPCPPRGKAHRYFIRLYAMPHAKLNVPRGATPRVIAGYADAMALGRAQLMARYGR